MAPSIHYPLNSKTWRYPQHIGSDDAGDWNVTQGKHYANTQIHFGNILGNSNKPTNTHPASDHDHQTSSKHSPFTQTIVTRSTPLLYVGIGVAIIAVIAVLVVVLLFHGAPTEASQNKPPSKSVNKNSKKSASKKSKKTSKGKSLKNKSNKSKK